MARNYAQIKSEIWKDAHFKTHLSVDAQWMYFTLLSQPNLNGAGVLPLQDRRWKKLARGLTAEHVEAALAELQDHWYVLVDEETEEVLVRTFIRNDGLWKQPNVLKSALSHANNTMSDTLKAVIWHEVDRLPLDTLEKGRAKRTRAIIDGLRPTLPGTLPEGFMEPPGKASETPFAAPEQGQHAEVIPITRPAQEDHDVIAGQTDLLSGGTEGFGEGFQEGFGEPSGVGAGVGVGAGGSLVGVKDSYSASDEKPSSPHGEGQTERPEPGSDSDPQWREFWQRYPNRVSKKKARAAFARALKRTDFDRLMAGLERYLTRDRRALDGYVKDPTTWLNGDCWDDEPQRAAANGGPAPVQPQRSLRNEWMARQ